MPIAAYTTVNLAAPITLTSLGDGIRSALTTAGWGATFDDYVSGSERFLVYQRHSVVGQAAGFIRIRLTSTSVRPAAMSSWNATTKVGGDIGQEGSFTSLSNSNITLHIFGGSAEFSGVILQQGTTTNPIIWVSPETAPNWWNRTLTCYGFVAFDSSFVNWFAPSSNPFGSSQGYGLQSNSGTLGGINRVTNRRDSLSNALLTCPSSEGIAGRFSPEIGQGACNGLARFDRLVDDSFIPAREHLVLGNLSGGLIVRIL